MAKKLPIGLQDFRTIIAEGYKYIDKTEYVYKLCTSGTFFFLSRPRRFGKSITIATLQELYNGSRDLFKGLWIEDKWDWDKKHPVIRISFTGIGFQSLGLTEAITQELNTLAEKRGVVLSKSAIGPMFRELIDLLAVDKKVVVLIDEYDAPIIQYLGKDIGQAQANREILKEFYTVLKDADSKLEFVFLTGVSKFSKVGIFSGLNNLQDITMSPQYATMLGYTQEELESNFAEEIEDTARYLACSKQELLDKIRLWYNGYRFSYRANTVYNPVSVNLFFTEQEFKNFWFATGTPTFLINVLKTEGLYDFKLQPQSEQSFDSFDLEDLNPYGLLYQTGYLTIKSKNEFDLYELDYPNHEVENSMLAYLLEAFGGVRKGSGLAMAIQLEQAFFASDLDQVIRILQTLFKGLPYQLYEKQPEKFYHAAIHLLFSYMGLRVHSEVSTSDGRADCVVETDTHIYILEFKLDESAEAALAQIRRKKYYQAWWLKGKPVIGVGVNFSSQTKNIEAWKSETLG
ncbi:MAG: AAA family ATPase [Saprospiraceae bacterium]